MGATVWLESVVAEDCVDNYARAFSESASRFVVSVPSELEHLFQETLAAVSYAKIGEVVREEKLTVLDREEILCSLQVQELKASWQSYNELGPYNGE